MGSPVVNDGNNASAAYYRFNTAQEAVPSVRINVVTSSQSFINACQTRGANSIPANGVNRQTNPLAYVQSLMDSVRFQRVSVERQRTYQGQIIRYFVALGDFSALEQYTATIPVANREATYTFNLCLLRTHAGKHQLSLALRAQQRLLALAPTNDEVRQEVALLNLLARADGWPAAGNRLPKADSVTLAQVAASGTTVAEQAATWLRYYYPHAAPYREPRQLPVDVSTTLLVQSKGVESELYPNPAATTVVVRYRMARAGQTIDLQIFSLLTSKQVLLERMPVASSDERYGEHTVDLRRLPAGQYSYRFVVDGKAQVAHHFVVQK